MTRSIRTARRRRAASFFAVLVTTLFVATACASGGAGTTSVASQAIEAGPDRPESGAATTAADADALESEAPGEPFHPDGFAGITSVPTEVYDPFTSGEEAPDGFRQLLRRDLIAPVYDPQFVQRSGVGWPEDELVIGVDLEGEARAYPVGFLNRREIVVDLHRGVPTLVTW